MKERATLICRREDQILYVRKAKSRWNLPGGKIEKNESPAAAAARELQEETGLLVVELVFLGAYESDDTLHHLFEARLADNAQPKAQNEIAECRWQHRRQLHELRLTPNARAIIKTLRAA
ncbi:MULTISPECIES: NUDIX hydrolase [Pseudomonas]|uniref:NUDIX domain-containing protein n=1 Tax=Pseudomonas eucalypticola TaxID=2599595 RepID=A0A7D5HNM6_9PSED|nr:MULTISPECIES: NUDIX domain-containing protein [Pseudomonas]QKZ04588.1 NUDIX domain-containing protein [Pseudomonas eucalypticola]